MNYATDNDAWLSMKAHKAYYENKSSYPKPNAQQNLVGRTHYVDDATLRFHKSRIISARHVYDGLLFAIVTSDAVDYENTKRGFRFVIFDLFGNVIERTELEQAFRTSGQATAAMWKALEVIDAEGVTIAAIDQAERYFIDDMEQLRQSLMTVAVAA